LKIQNLSIVEEFKKIETQKKERLIELDLWRGTAVFGMIIYHIFVVNNLLDLSELNLNSVGFLSIARYVQISFLLLVGISLSISRIHTKDPKSFYKKQVLRGLVVGICAFIITAATKVYIPDQFVFFGILHLISFSIFTLMFLANKRLLSLLIGIWILMIGFVINVTPMPNFFPWIILGFKVEGLRTLDWFSIFPWTSVICFGIFIGTYFEKYLKIRPDFKIMEKSRIVNVLVMMGKNALLIYMIHMPIILGFAELYKLLFY